MKLLGLKASARKSLDRDSLDRLQKLELWDLHRVRVQIQRKLGWTSRYALRIEREYRRFLALVAMNPSRPYGMGGDVDVFWHAHILNTQDYAECCHAVVGGFVHHAPSDGATSPSDNVIELYRGNTLADLAVYFKASPNSAWPLGEMDGVARCGGSCCKDVVPTAA